MRIQDACSNCCTGIKEFASIAVSKIGRTITAVGHCIGESARKAAEVAKPHFESLKVFAQEHRRDIVITTVAVIIGAIGAAIINKIFCRATDPGPSNAT
jgi:hypothetical protein